jgi:hypothetical protein
MPQFGSMPEPTAGERAASAGSHSWPTSRDTPAPRTRPWVAAGRSHEWEWNGRVGQRFATKERAEAHAARLIEGGCWDVHVLYAPIAKGRQDLPARPRQRPGSTNRSSKLGR